MNELNKPEVPQQATNTSWQRFTVSYEFPVCITHGLFSPENPVLVETLSRLEPSKRHRLLIFIDSGVVQSSPNLITHIKAYMHAYSEQLELVIDPVSMPGG